MSHQQITDRIVVAFDVFSKSSIDLINTKVTSTFEFEPKVEKSTIIGREAEKKIVHISS